MKHTKGTWEMDDENVLTAIKCGEKHIAMVNLSDHGTNDPRTIGLEEHIANALLIATSPQLYGRAKLLVKNIKLMLKQGKIGFKPVGLTELEDLLELIDSPEFREGEDIDCLLI